VSAALRVDGLLALASLDAANGRLESATRHWREAAALDPHASLLHGAMTMAAPRIAFPDEALRSVRAQLLTSDAELASSGLSRGETRSVRRYLASLLSLRLGDTTALADAQRTLAQAPASDRLAGPLGAALTGHLAKARGDLARALTAFARSDVALPVRSRSRVPALAQHADRLARAEVLERLQRPDEAAQWYAALRDGPFVWGAPYLVGVRD
jgi:tetratricopeptide (TPR) repeat protein